MPTFTQKTTTTAIHPCIEAAREGQTETVDRSHRYRGADIEAKDDRRLVHLLHIAISSGQTETVIALIDKGADIHARDSDGYTSLHCSRLSSGRTEAAIALIDRGADIEAQKQRRWYNTPLH